MLSTLMSLGVDLHSALFESFCAKRIIFVTSSLLSNSFQCHFLWFKPYVTFQISRSSKTSGTVFTMKRGSFFMILHDMFFQIATTSVLFVTKFALKSIPSGWRFFFIWMNCSFVWDHSMFFQENFGTL